jgi:hypothetical protein
MMPAEKSDSAGRFASGCVWKILRTPNRRVKLLLIEKGYSKDGRFCPRGHSWEELHLRGAGETPYYSPRALPFDQGMSANFDGTVGASAYGGRQGAKILSISMVQSAGSEKDTVRFQVMRDLEKGAFRVTF